MHSIISSMLVLATSITAQQYSTPTPPKGTQIDTIPQLGLGTWYLRGNTSEVIADAIVNGYRHIDCAKAYGNQVDIGKGSQEGLKRTGLKREDLWITSKLWNDGSASNQHDIWSQKETNNSNQAWTRRILSQRNPRRATTHLPRLVSRSLAYG